MKLPAILASDLHLTANPADEYRWGLFPWLCGELRAEKAETLLLLGDLTDAKDYHPAQLVNRVVDGIQQLRASVRRVVILCGNHDLLKSGNMFFEFLHHLPGVDVITQPTEDAAAGELTYYLPHSRDPALAWKGLDFSHYRYLFMHQTVKGSIASNGQQMDGEALPELNAGKVWSGDIHVPQVIGGVEYVGSPYHVHFGDRFVPRCVAIDYQHRQFDLHYPCLSRVTLDVGSIGELGDAVDLLRRGDQVKVRVALHESEKHTWKAVRAEAAAMIREADLELHGLELRVGRTRARAGAPEAPARRVDPVDAVYSYVDADELGGTLLDAALEVME